MHGEQPVMGLWGMLVWSCSRCRHAAGHAAALFPIPTATMPLGKQPRNGLCCCSPSPLLVFLSATGAAAFSPDLETKAVPAVGHSRMVPSCDPGLSHGSTPGRWAAGARCPEHSFPAPSIIPRRLRPMEMAMTCCAIPARRLPWMPACLCWKRPWERTVQWDLKVFSVLKNSLQPPLSPSTGTAPSFHVTVPCLPGAGCTGSVLLCRKATALLLPPLPFALQCLTHVQVGPMGHGSSPPALTNHSSKHLPRRPGLPHTEASALFAGICQKISSKHCADDGYCILQRGPWDCGAAWQCLVLWVQEGGTCSAAQGTGTARGASWL